MGLDMFLKAGTYVSTYNHQELLSDLHKLVGETAFSCPIPEDSKDRTLGDCGIEFTVAYWRKANAIHAWLLEEIAPEGGDNCQPLDVSVETLTELRDICRAVLELRTHFQDGLISPDALVEGCMELLPTQSGFFFGSTEIGPWYFEDMEYTVERLTQLLDWYGSNTDNGIFPHFIYQASW